MPFARILFETSAELRRVSWPNREAVASNTILVLATVAALTAAIAALDYVVGGGVMQLLRLGS